MSFTDRIVYILLMFATTSNSTSRQERLTKICYEQKFLLKKQKKFIKKEYGFLKMKKTF